MYYIDIYIYADDAIALHRRSIVSRSYNSNDGI